MNRLDRACLQAQRGLRYVRLGEPELPTFPDVCTFLKEHHPPLKTDICSRVMDAYLEAISNGAEDFATIAACLSAALG